LNGLQETLIIRQAVNFICWSPATCELHFTWCKIWGFHGGEDSSRSLLSCEDVQCCGRIPTFRRTLLPPSSGWVNSRWR